jgi:pimeloyl-ACP methyl ester carboxylesterase
MTIPTQSGFAEIDGLRLYYEVAGSGEPVLFVHAGIADSRMWDDQFFEFAHRYQAIRYDMRGYGRTTPIDKSYTHHNDLLGLLQFLERGPVHLIGCSMGGSTCLDFALEHPAQVKSLTLVGASPGGFEYEGEPSPLWSAIIPAFEGRDFERTAELEVQLWVDGRGRTPNDVPATIRNRVRAMDLIALINEAAALGTELRLQPPSSQRLDQLRKPTLILVGNLDAPSILAAADFMVERITGARKVIMPGTAHLPNMEKPQEFNQIVLEFLRRLA